MVGAVGVEPTTYGLRIRRYYQLSYAPLYFRYDVIYELDPFFQGESLEPCPAYPNDSPPQIDEYFVPSLIVSPDRRVIEVLVAINLKINLEVGEGEVQRVRPNRELDLGAETSSGKNLQPVLFGVARALTVVVFTVRDLIRIPLKVCHLTAG